MPAPWERYQQQAGQAPENPVIAPPDPYRQAADQRAQQDQANEGARLQIEMERLRLAQEAAARDAAKAAREEQQASGALSEQDRADVRTEAERKLALIDSLEQRSRDGWFATGFGASTASALPGTTASDVSKDVQTLAAAGALQRIMEMAAANGGKNPLTPLSNADFQALGQSIANLDPTQSDAQFQRNLQAYRDIYRRALIAAGGNPDKREEQGPAPPPLGAESATPPASSAPGAGSPPVPSEGPGTPPMLGPLVNLEGQIAGNVHDNGDNPAMGIARGEVRREDNPILAGVRDEYIKRLGRGDSAEQLIRWARDAGVHPSAFPSISAQVRFRREHPEISLGEYDTSEMDDRFVPLTQAERQAAEDVDTVPGAYLANAGDAASGFTLDNIIGLTGGNAERARAAMSEIGDRHPIASAAGTITGGTLMALGGEAALGARGMAAGLPRALLADTAYGAAAGAGAADYGPNGEPASLGDRAFGAAQGALAAGAGSVFGNAGGNALAAMGRGVRDASVNALRSEGVNALTVGQTFGNSGRIGAAVKGIEDRIAGLPVVGEMVNARRADSVRQFNSRAFDKALEPIGGTVGNAVGEDAVNRAQQAVTDAFTTALAGKGATPDAAFSRDLASAVQGVRSIKRIGDEITDEIGEIMLPYANEPMLSGEALDDISRNLRDLKSRYMQDPLGARAAKQIDRVERSVFDLFDRQASGTIPEYQAARQAYRRVSILEDAVLKARNQKDRMFTPAQLGQADRGNARKFGGKRAAARGDTPFHDYQTAAQDVLPNRVPDSGTVGRALVPLALVGGGAGADQMGAGGYGLTIGGILAALYSKTGQRFLTKPGRGMKAGTSRRAVMESPATRRALAATGAAGSAALLTGPE